MKFITLKRILNHSRPLIKDKEIKTTPLNIETLTDSVHPIGKPIKFYISFDDKNSEKVEILVKIKTETKTVFLNKPSEFIFFPTSRGKYKFSFDNGIKKVIKEIRVIDIEPIIQNTKLPTLYIGIDNPLKIKITGAGDGENLYVTISDGVIKKKEIFLLHRLKEKVLLKLRFLPTYLMVEWKIAEQQFTVRELQPPIPSINNNFNGTEISTADLKDLKKISLKTDEYLVDEEVYVAEFDFMKIYNNETSVTKPVKNMDHHLIV